MNHSGNECLPFESPHSEMLTKALCCNLLKTCSLVEAAQVAVQWTLQ